MIYLLSSWYTYHLITAFNRTTDGNFSCFIGHRSQFVIEHIAGLEQDCGNSIGNALELLQSCVRPSIWYIIHLSLSWCGSNLMTSSNKNIFRVPGTNSPHKGQWRGALMFALICVWINGWVNTREAGDLGRHRAHYDVTVVAVCKQDMSPWRPLLGLLSWCPVFKTGYCS